MQKLVLWDIDDTLIQGNGATEALLRHVLVHTFGPAPVSRVVAFAGKTDQQIILDMYAPRPAHELLATLPQFTACYLNELPLWRGTLLAQCAVHAGVYTVLAYLASIPVIQSVVTGNLRPVAQYKLQLFDLLTYLDTQVGAYGDDGLERTQLVPIAVQRATAQYQQSFQGHQVVVIGDTPRDIVCGQAAGAYTIAVATGSWSAEALRAAGADVVLPNLADTAAVVNAILTSHC